MGCVWFIYRNMELRYWLVPGNVKNDQQSALQTSQRENNERIPFTLTFHPHNHVVKSIILKNFKLLQNDPDTGRIFSQPPLISLKRDKNIGNFLVRSVFQTSEQPGIFKCARAQCKTCPFIRKVEKISGPKRSIGTQAIISPVPQPMSSTA